MGGLGNSLCLALNAKQVQAPSLSHTQAIKMWLSPCSLYWVSVCVTVPLLEMGESYGLGT